MEGPGVRPRAGETLLTATVRATAARHRMLLPGDRVLVAVSGGPDSVALLHALHLLAAPDALSLHVAHVHHGLRPEADQDAAFVEELAGRFGLPVSVDRVTVALGGGRSPEEAARLARYRALERRATLIGAGRIAVGHTADDQAETVLMRLLQGAGPLGLAGIPPVRGRVVRPLLEATRAMVLAHLHAYGLPWIEDATNADPKFLRNRLRHDLLPLLAAHYSPRIGEALARVARGCREAAEALRVLVRQLLPDLVREEASGWLVLAEPLRRLPPGAQKACLREALIDLAGLPGLRATHLAALAALLEEGREGSRVRLPGGQTVERVREGLHLPRPAAPPAPVPLAVPGETVAAPFGLTLTAELLAPPAPLPADPRWEALFDWDALPRPLVLRPRRPGDRFVPFGGPGGKALSAYLIDERVLRHRRDRLALLVGGDEVLWVVGLRRGQAAPLTPGTHRVLRIRARERTDAPGERR